MKRLLPKPLTEELTTDQQIRRRTLKALLGFGLAGLAPVGIWNWLKSQPDDSGILAPLRQVLTINEKITGTLLNSQHLAPTFPKSMATRKPRVNSLVGLENPPDIEDYQVQIEQPLPSGKLRSQAVSLADLQTLPHQEIVFEFKCIEGWSQIQHWGGVCFVDFVRHYRLGTRNGKPSDPDHSEDWFSYVGMETPDGSYYVGIDMASALHPQTLLAYEMNGHPLTEVAHGAPLRLIIPVKYGVKNLKRIGVIRFADSRPPDYWAEEGYDYFIGL
jgi:hypothetical protein